MVKVEFLKIDVPASYARVTIKVQFLKNDLAAEFTLSEDWRAGFWEILPLSYGQATIFQKSCHCELRARGTICQVSSQLNLRHRITVKLKFWEIVSCELRSVLQCVAVCCSVLQCVAVCCSALQCVAVRCSALQCVEFLRNCILWATLKV